MSSKGKRVTLTKSQASSKVGTKMIEALELILDDGKITPKEVLALKDWLRRAAKYSDLYAIKFLQEEVDAILADGEITEEETRSLAYAALRVLPADRRERISEKIDRVIYGGHIDMDDLATDRQRSFIQELGGRLSHDATKEEASHLIESLLETQPSVRQRMVLRFWGKEDLSYLGRDGVSGWMDQFYSEDPYRLTAWELWKKLTPGSSGRSHRLIENVPRNAGWHYVNLIKENRKSRRRSVFVIATTLLLIVAVIIVSATVFLLR
jgi:hypothetical protein